jgi:hypothetical protein
VGEGGIPVEVVRCDPAWAHLIRNLYPLYLHDLSKYSGELPNAHGVYEPDPSVRTLAEQADLPCWAVQLVHPAAGERDESDRRAAGFRQPHLIPRQHDFT